MNKILKLFGLLLIMAMAFSCTQEQKEAVVAKLFDITGTPAIGDYTNDVGIIASADMKTLNVDYTGLNIDEEISRFGNISISTSFYHDTVPSYTNSYSDSLSWNSTADNMQYNFHTNNEMVALPQYNASYTSTDYTNFFKFSTVLECEDVNTVTPLVIKRTLLSLAYTPDLMDPDGKITYFFEANNNGYGPLTLIGYNKDNVIHGDSGH